MLTVFDGNQKAVIIAIRNELGIPVKFVGVGEGHDGFTAVFSCRI